MVAGLIQRVGIADHNFRRGPLRRPVYERSRMASAAGCVREEVHDQHAGQNKRDPDHGGQIKRLSIDNQGQD
jgi:hypothetical protein